MPDATLWVRRGLNPVILACALMLTGCRFLHPGQMAVGPEYQPQNTFAPAATLPADVRRVAVLPLMAERTAALTSGKELLEPLVIGELLKTQKFEVVRATPESLRVYSGRSGWTGEEVLPESLLTELREASGCDAVLFCQLTAFRAYAPLVVGWRMKLVDVNSRQILWAADEVFDGGQPAVKNGAQRYQMQHFRSLDDGRWTMENSPRFFGQYTISRLLETLPAR